MQNTKIGAFPLEGSQRAKTIMAEKAVVVIITLKRPSLSAIMPGRIRPNIEAAFRIDKRYDDRLSDILSA